MCLRNNQREYCFHATRKRSHPKRAVLLNNVPIFKKKDTFLVVLAAIAVVKFAWGQIN